MARDNNGVASTVKHNIGVGSENRGGGEPAEQRDNGGAPNQMNIKPKTADMASHHGPAGSSGTTKGNGGVGDMGAGAPCSVEPGDR